MQQLAYLMLILRDLDESHTQPALEPGKLTITLCNMPLIHGRKPVKVLVTEAQIFSLHKLTVTLNLTVMLI